MFTGTLPPVSNQADWIESYELYDDETGEALDITSATEITIAIRDPNSKAVRFTATLTGGEIEHIETGVFQWTFALAQMQELCEQTYDVGMTLLMDDITTQILIGHQPVVDGIVS